MVCLGTVRGALSFYNKITGANSSTGKANLIFIVQYHKFATRAFTVITAYDPLYR